MNTYIYDNRLIKFAQHLENLKEHPEHKYYEELLLTALEPGYNVQYGMKFHCWLLDELVVVFPDDWSFHFDTGVAILKDWEPYESDIAMFLSFFFLDLEDFSIFDLEGFTMTERFGGKKLTLDATPKDIAFNIREFVKSRSKSKRHKK